MSVTKTKSRSKRIRPRTPDGADRFTIYPLEKEHELVVRGANVRPRLSASQIYVEGGKLYAQQRIAESGKRK